MPVAKVLWVECNEAAGVKAGGACMECNRKAETAGSGSFAGGVGTILLVEDQEIVRQFMCILLEEEGYQVAQAADGAEALRIAADRSLNISLLITDIVMPRMSGAQLARRLEESRPGLRTLFVSGYSWDLEAGTHPPSAMRAFLPKPYTPEQFCEQVARMFKPAGNAGTALPRTEPVMPVHQEPEPESSTVAPGFQRQAGTIVVADDDLGVRNFLRTILTSVGYEVLEAKNGKEAMRQVETSEVDLVITDLAMPEQEGIETIQWLHRLKPQLKIIAMSGQFAGPLLRMAQHLGAQESLAKPIDPDELLDAVVRVMTVG